MSNFRGIVPSVDDADNLGWSSLRWVKGWFKDLFCNGVLTDGTTSHAVSELRDAMKIRGKEVDDAAIADKYHLAYLASSDKIVYRNWTLETDDQIAATTAATSTTSMLYIDLDGMTLTTAGTVAKVYNIAFSMRCNSSNNDKVISAILRIDGVEIAGTDAGVIVKDLNKDPDSMCITWQTTIAPSKIVKVRWNVDGNTAYAYSRRLTISATPVLLS